MPPSQVIAITQGDPAGVGPELCLKAVQDPSVRARFRPVIIGDICVLRQVAEVLDLTLPGTVIDAESLESIGSLGDADFPLIVDCGCLTGPVQPAVATAQGGRASYRYIELAIRGAQSSLFDAVTTAPINKTTLRLAGITDAGHTEIFGRLTGTEHFAMMLYSPRLAVSFVTCHQSLRSVTDSLSVDRVVCVAGLLADALRRLLGREPRLAVLGFNPHAGEGGIFGDEDDRIIAPAVELCRSGGLIADGPVPPDTAFSPAALDRYDGHVAMYHDQGHIPFKMVSFQDGVNVTLGLPIIRTSVDHGTAYDIAWRGRADVVSLIEAIKLGTRLTAGPPTCAGGG